MPQTRQMALRQVLFDLQIQGTTMKSRWGNVKIIQDSSGRYVRGWPRKKYTRSKPYQKPSMRIAISNREAAAYVMLRKKGHRLHHIAKAFGRSVSLVWRRISFYSKLSPFSKFDMRKMPNKTRLINSYARWKSLLRWLPLWEKWICGEGEEPP